MAETSELISIVCPTRRRPENVQRFIASARGQAAAPERVQFVFYVDEDDDTFPLAVTDTISVIRGPRVTLSLMSNACLPSASGQIIMYAGDDLEFLTDAWDLTVRACFKEVPDHIVLVHGDDLGQNPLKLATHGFVHRAWIEAVGYLIPPYFPADWSDTWLTEVADRVGRRWYVSELKIEHRHYAWGKGVLDATHRERLERLKNDRVASRYRRLRAERRLDASKLKAVMDDRRLPPVRRLGVPNWWLPNPGSRVLHRPRWLQ